MRGTWIQYLFSHAMTEKEEENLPRKRKRKANVKKRREGTVRWSSRTALPTWAECGTRIDLQTITNYNLNYPTPKENEERRKNKGKKHVPHGHVDDADQLDATH
jgi:hypothetical protein